MKVLDLFSGVGGFSLGFERAGFETIAFSEVEPFPCKVLSHRWPGVPNLGDITKITEEQVWALGEIDVVTFGSPCQDWSVAGKRLGLEGHRSSLFHEAIRIVRAARPRFAIFENVPGLFSSASGWDFAAVLDEMADAGALDIAWSVLDAQWFGVPQRRRRVFVVCDFGGESAGEILSISEGVYRDSEESREEGQGVARSIEGGAGADGQQPYVVHAAESCARQRHAYPTERARSLDSTGGFASSQGGTVISTLQGGGRRGYRVDAEGAAGGHLIAHSLTGEGHDASEDGTGRGTPLVPTPFDTTQITSDKNYSNPREGDPCHPLASGAHPPAVAFTERTRKEGRNFEYLEDQAYALTNPGSGGRTHSRQLVQGMAVRRLTPKECERLQGFPDDWTNVSGASDSGRYRAMGNAVCVNVIGWIANRIKPHLEWA